LHNLQIENTISFELQASKAARDWTQEKGKETCCKILSKIARSATSIPEMDDGETIWQLNWVLIAEPSQGDTLTNNDGTRVWFPLAMRDFSGPLVLHITEQAATKLTNAVDAAEFLQMHSENRLRFPLLSSLKVWRKPKKILPASAVQPGSDAEFDCFIVDAQEQDMGEAPSQTLLTLLPMLDSSVDIVLLTTLEMIRKPEHYALAVEYVTQQLLQEFALAAASNTVAGVSLLRPCSKAVALISSTKRSQVLAAGAGGHKLVTDDVVDYLSPQTDAKFTLTSFCTLNTVTDFKLDPPRGAKSQAALVTLTDVLSTGEDNAAQPVTSLLVDTVQLLTPDEAKTLGPVLAKMIYFATLAGQITRKRELESWTAQENPAKASTCRHLGRSPTGPALPDYKPSP